MQTLIILVLSFSSNSLLLPPHSTPPSTFSTISLSSQTSIIRPPQILSQSRQIIKQIHPLGFENELNTGISKMQTTRANRSAPTQYLHKLNMDPSSAFLCHPTEHTQHGSMMEQLNERGHLPNAGQNWDHKNKSILGFKKIKVCYWKTVPICSTV